LLLLPVEPFRYYLDGGAPFSSRSALSGFVPSVAAQENGKCQMDKLLKVQEVATILGVTTAWVYDHANRKRPRLVSPERAGPDWLAVGARAYPRPLPDLLNTMASQGDSYSAVRKVRMYLNAMVGVCLDERLISENPARKLELPTQLLRSACERFYTPEKIRRLLSKSHGREHLMLRIFMNCGLHRGELFALREDDVEPGRLRINEAGKDVERGDLGDQNSWEAHGQQGPYHTTSSGASDLLFPSKEALLFAWELPRAI
jgi:integrase